MISLRARLVALIVLSVVAVVGLATFVAIRVIGPPGPEHSMEATGEQIHLIAELVEEEIDPTHDGDPEIGLLPGPMPGEVDEPLTRWLRMALARTGEDLPVVVTRSEPPRGLMVSIPITDRGWYALPLADRPPPPGWGVLLGWLGAVTFGTALIAIAIANRMIRPLTLLEGAVAAVGAAGTMPRLPENGPIEVRATASAINRLSERLQGAMESRMRLVAAAGHDLRTPMTRMRLRAEFVADEEERALWLADIEELDRIADSAIRLVREEAAKTESRPIELDALVTSLADDLAQIGLAVRVAATVPATVKAEPLALSRALRNLMINGALHGGGATVSTVVDGGAAVVRIDDDGPGIPEALLGRVFEPFFRVDQARRRSAPGAGLGLAIAHEIVARAGGTITLSNRTPHGLRQDIRMPLAAAS